MKHWLPCLLLLTGAPAVAAEDPALAVLDACRAKLDARNDVGLARIEERCPDVMPALQGAPGVHSARYAGQPKSDGANNARLVAELAAHADKSAYYFCVLVLVRHADDPQPLIAEGRWDGEIIASPRGTNGFGYDPHFWLPALGKTAAELSMAQKNQWSHRAQALRVLVEKLR